MVGYMFLMAIELLFILIRSCFAHIIGNPRTKNILYLFGKKFFFYFLVNTYILEKQVVGSPPL